MYRDDKSIPVKRVRLDSSSGQYIDAPMSVPFIRGPIPLAWLNVAARLPGKTLNVGLAIWWLAGMSKPPPSNSRVRLWISLLFQETLHQMH